MAMARTAIGKKDAAFLDSTRLFSSSFLFLRLCIRSIDDTLSALEDRGRIAGRRTFMDTDADIDTDTDSDDDIIVCCRYVLALFLCVVSFILSYSRHSLASVVWSIFLETCFMLYSGLWWEEKRDRF
jgi:hypothetical protein